MGSFIKKGFLLNVRNNSKYFLNQLNLIKKKYPKVIKEIRGIGLLIGIQVNVDLSIFINIF